MDSRNTPPLCQRHAARWRGGSGALTAEFVAEERRVLRLRLLDETSASTSAQPIPNERTKRPPVSRLRQRQQQGIVHCARMMNGSKERPREKKEKDDKRKDDGVHACLRSRPPVGSRCPFYRSKLWERKPTAYAVAFRGHVEPPLQCSLMPLGATLARPVSGSAGVEHTDENDRGHSSQVARRTTSSSSRRMRRGES